MTTNVRNTLGADATGYIRRERLQDRLRVIFKLPITVELRNDRFVFYAPRLVTEDEIE
ncbi:hypothetical protein P170DRAFT_477311 [Aspergillus steynii IBT 23096]|uniref:Uncharacterized protein n=1 Tax=Aspergillus steynii IBT 23096 TaxID=1392250 RepID=A0A2I2G0M4_9EURO|nr:uncharacterized protein P170DRAFT_477311 [Aspergillus steynii IBT 23096]PLB46430.1 hypothetical protein P170DRAFT_477311 [Aspergillus steynii IBT 23096]